MGMDLSDHLHRSAVRIFEQLTFVYADSELDEDQRTASFGAGARVDFSGPACGRLTIHVYGDVLDILTRNMLPDLEKPSRSMQVDTLKEIANVICGNLLPAIAGRDAVFELEPPEEDDSPEPSSETSAAAVRVTVGLEAGRAELSLRLDQPEENGRRAVP